jgi:hypothetical protein
MTNIPVWLLGGRLPHLEGMAWIIDIGLNKPAGLARYKAECCGPSSLKEANAAALAMAKEPLAIIGLATP